MRSECEAELLKQRVEFSRDAAVMVAEPYHRLSTKNLAAEPPKMKILHPTSYILHVLCLVVLQKACFIGAEGV